LSNAIKAQCWDGLFTYRIAYIEHVEALGLRVSRDAGEMVVDPVGGKITPSKSNAKAICGISTLLEPGAKATGTPWL